MVKEFDELQGIMGMYYSQKQGEEEEISKSIYEHYLPKTAEGNLPQTNLGTLLALADKLDTVISFIKIGELPKPSADPFGIRRNAIGIVRLLVEKEIDLDLRKIIDDESILDFILSRLESYLQSKGYKTDIINAVLSLKDGNIYRNYLKVKALSQLRNLPDYENVIMVFKRVGNIIPEDFTISNVDVNLLLSEPEKELYKKFVEIKDKFKQFIENKNYDKALGLMLELKPYIDRFFDNVMIMVEDEKLKNNRLSLLKEINDLFRNIADFTKLIGG
jgi:glycyl-tRNA synthetase beta chain